MDSASETAFWLLCLDVDRIQSYVYESARLPEVRGASAQLKEIGAGLGAQAEALAKARGLTYRHCYAAGGSLLGSLRGTEAAAQEVAAELCRRFPAETGVATATAVVVRCEGDPEKDKDIFQQARHTGAALLKRKKAGRTAVPYYEVPPVVTRCTSGITRRRWRKAAASTAGSSTRLLASCKKTLPVP